MSYTNPLLTEPLRRTASDSPTPSNDPVSILSFCRQYLFSLVSRLCPTPVNLSTKLTNVAIGSAVVQDLNDKGDKYYNGILCSLTSGTVNVYFGHVGAARLSTLVPDLHFAASENPVQIFFPIRNDPVTIWVDAGSTYVGNGSICLLAY